MHVGWPGTYPKGSRLRGNDDLFVIPAYAGIQSFLTSENLFTS